MSAANRAAGERLGALSYAGGSAFSDAQKRAMASQVDPLADAQEKRDAQLVKASAALKAGAITEEQHARAVAYTTATYNGQEAAIRRFTANVDTTGKAAKLSAFELQNLGYQANDVFTSLSSGIPLTQTLAQQGPQIYQVLAGSSGGLVSGLKAAGAAAAGFLAPFAAIGTAIGGVVALGAAWRSYTGTQTEVQKAVAGVGGASRATTTQINAAAAANAEAGGVSVREARSMAAEFASTGRIGVSMYGDLIRTTKDYAATTSQDVPDATKALAQSFASPATGAGALAKQLGFLNGEQLENIERMARQGEQLGAQQALMGPYRQSLTKAAELTSGWSSAVGGLTRGLSDLWDMAGRGVDKALNGGTLDEQLTNLDARLKAIKENNANSGFFGPNMALQAQIQAQRDEIAGKIAKREQDNAEKARNLRSLEIKTLVDGYNQADQILKKIEDDAKNIAKALNEGEIDRDGRSRRTMTALTEAAAQLKSDMAAGGTAYADAVRAAGFENRNVGTTGVALQRARIEEDAQNRSRAAVGNTQDASELFAKLQSIEIERVTRLNTLLKETENQAANAGGALARVNGTLREQIIGAARGAVTPGIIAGIAGKESTNNPNVGFSKSLGEDGRPSSAYGLGQITKGTAEAAVRGGYLPPTFNRMAEIIGAAIISASTAASIGATVGVSAAVVTTAVGSAAIIAGGAALNLIASSLSDDRQKQASTQFSSQQPMPSRQRSYGRVKLAGPKVAYGVVGGAFCYGLYHGEGPWDAIEEWWLDDIMVSFPAGSLGGSVPNVPWRGYVSIDSRLGTVPQTASGLLMGLDGYDATYRLDGCAFSAVQNRLPAENKFKAYYPKQTWSELRVTARTQKVRDVRDPAQTEDPATWKFTDRSGPNIYDFVTHPLWGLRIPPAMMNTAKWAAFNSLCDELFTDKAGNPVNRYSLGGTYQLTDDPADTLNSMLSTCDGRLTLEADGTIGITGGKFPTPTVTIADPAILAMQIDVGGSRYFEFTRLKLSFVSPVHDYQQVEGQAWINAAAEAESEEQIEQDFSRPWVQNYNQLRRLAKIAMAKGNPDLKLTGLVTDLSVAPALFEESVRLILSDYGIDAVFLVNRAVANIEAGTCTFDLASIDPSAYSFDPATEEGTPPTLPGAQAAEGPPPDPQGLTVLVEHKPVSGATNATFLRLTATRSDRQDYSLIGRYRLQGASEWTEMVQDGDDAWSLTSGVLNDGAAYEAEGAVSSYGRARVSNYLPADGSPIVATADTTSPGPPNGVVANGGTGQATYAFTMPDSPNAGRAAVYHNSTDNLRTATLARTHNAAPSQAIDGTIPGLPPGPRYVWVRALNASGYPALPTNPATPDPDASSTVRAPNPVTVT